MYIITKGILETYHKLEDVYEKFLSRDSDEIMKNDSFIEEQEMTKVWNVLLCVHHSVE